MMLLGAAREQPGSLPGRQVVHIRVDRGYRPETIAARAYVPIRLVFQREDDDVCSERVIFSRPRIERRLAARAQTTVDLPAQPPGTIRFTCGMGRYRGVIALEERSSSRADGFHRLPHRYGPSLAFAGIAWACTLPLLAMLMLLVLDPAGTVIAGLVALLVLLATCLWAFRRPGPPTVSTGSTGQGSSIAVDAGRAVRPRRGAHLR